MKKRERVGALLIDKPADWTSHDVVAKLRRVLKQRRIGHTGTLDPFATGLLIICLGKATRLSQYLMGEEKEYEAVIRFGFSTDTQDFTGKPISPLISSDQLTIIQLQQALSEFEGEYWQTPPLFSAKKIEGEALYHRARRGEDIERAAVNVLIHRTKIIPLLGAELVRNDDGTTDVAVQVVCSAGTYLRTLAHDLGARLGYGAHLTALRRVRIGNFSLDAATKLAELVDKENPLDIENRIISAASLIVNFETQIIEDEELPLLLRGHKIKSRSVVDRSIGEKVRLLNKMGELVAIGELVEEGQLLEVQPRILFITDEE